MTDRMRQRREWNRYLEFIDSVIADEAEAKAAQAAAKPATASPLPATPQAHRQVHRLSLEEQDEWSDRMRTRYGGEW